MKTTVKTKVSGLEVSGLDPLQVIPMSCKHETRIIPGELTLFGETSDIVEKDECEGCEFNRPTKHNGKYVQVMDWTTQKPLRFIDLTN